MNNLLTDIAGVRVGHADDAALASGVTAVIFDEPAIASIDIRGGGPGTRDCALLDPRNTVETVDGLALSGGSAFGIESGAGVQAWLKEQGRGFPVGTATIPIVPGAVVFDLINGGNKDWGRFAPYRDLGYLAASKASDRPFALGSVGAGLGATTATVKGGLGSASAKTSSGITVAALVVANPVGNVLMGDGPHFWAAPFEQGDEFGGRGMPDAITPDMLKMRIKGVAPTSVENTTIAVIVTDAILTKAQAQRLAMMTQTGFARAIYPVHCPLDGDLVFAAATCKKAVEPVVEFTELGMLAANVMARAIARGVYEASALPFADAAMSWRDRFG